MVAEFSLQGKAFSINKAYYATRKSLTAEARMWQSEIAAQLEELKVLSEFALEFKDRPGPIELRLCFNYPHHLFYNQQGQISSKTYDVDNSCKLIIDMLFSTMGINDKNIVKLVAEKRVGASHSIDVKIILK